MSDVALRTTQDGVENPMTGSQLNDEIVKTGTDREWLTGPSGLEGRFSLFEEGKAGAHLLDATPQQILEFVGSVELAPEDQAEMDRYSLEISSDGIERNDVLDYVLSNTDLAYDTLNQSGEGVWTVEYYEGGTHHITKTDYDNWHEGRSQISDDIPTLEESFAKADAIMSKPLYHEELIVADLNGNALTVPTETTDAAQAVLSEVNQFSIESKVSEVRLEGQNYTAKFVFSGSPKGDSSLRRADVILVDNDNQPIANIAQKTVAETVHDVNRTDMLINNPESFGITVSSLREDFSTSADSIKETLAASREMQTELFENPELGSKINGKLLANDGEVVTHQITGNNFDLDFRAQEKISFQLAKTKSDKEVFLTTKVGDYTLLNVNLKSPEQLVDLSQKYNEALAILNRFSVPKINGPTADIER